MRLKYGSVHVCRTVGRNELMSEVNHDRKP